MGFSIIAYDTRDHSIAWMEAYMGAFRMCREQGYDWFELIHATEHDAGVSGNGESKMIKLEDLKFALMVLGNHDPGGKLADNLDGTFRDEWTERKPMLKKFMETCVQWCEKNGKIEVKIAFR